MHKTQYLSLLFFVYTAKCGSTKEIQPPASATSKNPGMGNLPYTSAQLPAKIHRGVRIKVKWKMVVRNTRRRITDIDNTNFPRPLLSSPTDASLYDHLALQFISVA